MSIGVSGRANTKRENTVARIKTLQEDYRRAFSSRFRALRGAIRETIQENDALDISGGYETRINAAEDIEAEDEFQFTQEAAKQVAFFQQLQQWIDEGVLEPISDSRIKDGFHYTAPYVKKAYEEGIDFSNGLLVENGIDVSEDVQQVVGRPIHTEELRVLYTRNYQGLEGITEDLDRMLSSKFVEAMRKGWGTRKTADKINKEARDIQHTRARTLARTEMGNAHTKASIANYKQNGIQTVEILTHTPCEEYCIPIKSNDPYNINDIPFGGPPFHPNCVCALAPLV